MIHVVWHEGTDGFTKPNGRSGYSCCTLLNQMFDQYNCTHWSTFPNLLPYIVGEPHVDGAVIVIQGGNERERVEEINADAALLKWVIFIIIGDEGCDFPLKELHHPNSKVWFQYPQPGYTLADRYMVVGPSRDVPQYLTRSEKRTINWFFAGQNTHIRRHQCVEQLMFNVKKDSGVLVRTAGFEQGMSSEDYFRYMAQSYVIPCPSGPASPDTFRMYEALEFGCVPIGDRYAPRYVSGNYWTMVFNKEPPPFPIVNEWVQLPDVLRHVLEDWDRLTLECRAWWTRYKFDFFTWLHEDLQCLTK